MPTAKLYPELISVRIPITLAEAIEDRLADDDEGNYDGGLSGAMRDAALRAIGRSDLIIEDVPAPSNAGKKQRRPDARWVISPVKLTVQQKRAIAQAAKNLEISSSYLMISALCAELKLPPRTPDSSIKLEGSDAERVRKLALRLEPSLNLPVTDAESVPLELRQRIAKKLGVRVSFVSRSLRSQPFSSGWQLGHRRSSPPKKR